MRLLHVETFRFEEFFGMSPPSYAILSHTWGKDSEEVSYRDVLKGRLDMAATRPAKISGCCNQANEDGYKYVWIDTCCIDKTNSVELQEAINSMFRWYQEAAVCYVFLSDVPAGDDPRDHQSAFFSSRWFRRGWTLQELLAPSDVRFYDSNWHYLGTKGDLSEAVEEITRIQSSFLLGMEELHDASVAQRMCWAARRVTKRKEDVAYCLLGIFGVAMPMIYGEGDRAFRRLQEQIMKDIGDDSILAWGLGSEGLAHDNSFEIIPGGALAASPSAFANCSRIASWGRPSNGSFDVHCGSLRLHLSLYTNAAGETLGLLKCGSEDDAGKVVGIPLAAASDARSGEYIRLNGRHTVLVTKPAAEGSELVQIRIDSERKLSASTSQPCWFHIRKFVHSLELIDVKPISRWHKRRALIKVAVEPNNEIMQRTLTRFRDQRNEGNDFIVVLEVKTQNSGLQAQCYVMIASRHTSLHDIAQKFDNMRPEAFGEQSASNGTLFLHISLKHAARQRTFPVELTAISKPPAVTINATLELQLFDQRVAIG
ncbi:Vegetative incompatibility protein HET-E-1, partial [Madurella mycetomatis]